MDPCPAFASGMGYAPDVLAMLDCKTEALARLGFGAFATSGSPAMVAIGGMMTLLVAFYGYRLLLGGRLDLDRPGTQLRDPVAGLSDGFL